MVTRQARGRALLALVALLLTVGVLGMHGLGTGHGLATTGHPAATAEHHHGPGASLEASSDHAAGGGGAGTRAGAAPGVGASTVLDHLTTAAPAAVSDRAQPAQESGVASTEACQGQCGAHGAVMAVCLAVLAVALALLLARGPGVLRRPWAALPVPVLLRGAHLVLDRAPGLHQLCVSRT